MAEKITRAWARAMAESVMRAGTKRGRQFVAAQFVRDVFVAIKAGDCSDPRWCAELAIRTWRKVSR